MSRAKTQNGEPFFYVEEVVTKTGEQVARWPRSFTISRARAFQEARVWRKALDPASELKVNVVKVTTFRLAPLVVLPAWEPAAAVEREWQTGLVPVACDKEPQGVGAAFWQFDEGPWGSWVEVNGNEWRNEEHATIDEARAACEKRLRELGYKVAKKAKVVT